MRNNIVPPELETCTDIQLSVLTGGWKDGTAHSLITRPYYVLIIGRRGNISLFFSFSEKYLLFGRKQPFAFKPFLHLESLLRIHFPSPEWGHCVVGTEKTQAVTGSKSRNITNYKLPVGGSLHGILCAGKMSCRVPQVCPQGHPSLPRKISGALPPHLPGKTRPRHALFPALSFYRHTLKSRRHKARGEGWHSR